MGKFFKRKARNSNLPLMVQSERQGDSQLKLRYQSKIEYGLYEALRYSVPVIDAAICKTVRLTGGYRIICDKPEYQEIMDKFSENVNVGLTGKGINCFTDAYLDSLLTFGNAVGEIIVNSNSMQIVSLNNGKVSDVEVKSGNSPADRNYFVRDFDGDEIVLRKISHPERIMFTALNPTSGDYYGNSILRGLPSISSILLRIYQCIGQNYDRMGNVRYAVTYKPTEDMDKALSRDRALQIAKEWSEGMNSGKNGDIRDFVAVGDVDIKVIGADNKLVDTNIPVRQMLEQILSKLSIPPFLLGLSWSSTERMSEQQADILTSELEYYRRLLNPVIKNIATAFLKLCGSDSGVEVVWDSINLQDESGLALARLRNAQASEIEARLKSL